ncbi:MAG: thiamine pyrophosphate-dependent dehydrogenase E1 component subunit alpha [Acidobacteriota bacterium]
MRRYPLYDPPEYVDFRVDPGVLKAFRDTLRRDPARRRIIERLGPAELLRLYEGMVRFRLHDITLKRWVRQGVISKAWLGTGEEAVTIGSVRALRRGDLVGPMIRNAGACHEMGMPVAQMLKAYLGTADQITRGRDLHTGDPALGVIPPTSMMANLVPVFTGIGLVIRQKRQKRVAITYVGDGASRTSAFHEGFNFAAVMKVPVIIVLQNNRIALGTPIARHSRGRMEEVAPAYGVFGLSCDGNNVLDVYAATAILAERCRAGRGPCMLTANTFRMGGHATHDEAEARTILSPEEFRYWGLRDPIGAFEAYLVAHGPALRGGGPTGAARREANRRALEEVESRVVAQVEAAEREALDSRRSRMPAPEDAAGGVWAEAAPARPPRGRRGATARSAERRP